MAGGLHRVVTLDAQLYILNFGHERLIMSA
jgi:hypothetical protein